MGQCRLTLWKFGPLPSVVLDLTVTVALKTIRLTANYKSVKFSISIVWHPTPQVMSRWQICDRFPIKITIWDEASSWTEMWAKQSKQSSRQTARAWYIKAHVLFSIEPTTHFPGVPSLRHKLHQEIAATRKTNWQLQIFLFVIKKTFIWSFVYIPELTCSILECNI